MTDSILALSSCFRRLADRPGGAGRRHLRHGPAQRPEPGQRPVVSHGAVREANPVAHEEGLRGAQQRASSTRQAFQNVPGGVEARPGLVWLWGTR